VFADHPKVARAGDRWARVVDLGDLVAGILLIRARSTCLQLTEEHVDLRHPAFGGVKPNWLEARKARP
jgi:hypothetical protein